MQWVGCFCYGVMMCVFFFFFKQKTAYEMRISDWSSDVCSSDLHQRAGPALDAQHRRPRPPHQPGDGGHRRPPLARCRLAQAARIAAPLGWHVDSYTNPAIIAASHESLATLPLPLLFYHFPLALPLPYFPSLPPLPPLLSSLSVSLLFC